MKFTKKHVLLPAVIFLVTACASPVNGTAKVQHEIQQSIDIEKKLPDIVQQLNQKEHTEENIFQQILKVRGKAPSEVQKLTKKAQSFASDRKKDLSKGQKIIRNAKSKVKLAEKDASFIRKQKIKKTLNSLILTDLNRYEYFNKWVLSYNQSIAEDKKLYKMLADPTVKAGQLEGQLEKVDTLYKTTLKNEQTFNRATKAWMQRYGKTNQNI